MLGLLGLFRRKAAAPATFTVSVMPHGRRFTAERGANLLDTALRQGLDVPYNCRVGACRTCRVRVVEGSARSTMNRADVFSREEIEAGAFLACQTRIESDLSVLWTAAAATHACSGRLYAMRSLTPRIHRVEVRLDRPDDWQVGQFAKLLPRGMAGLPRCFSLVGSGRQQHLLAFDVARREQGVVSRWLTDAANIGRALDLELPFGSFGEAVRDPAGAGSALLCIAGGSGQGAVAGLIEHHLRQHPAPTPVLLLVGARDPAEVYDHEALHRAARERGSALQVTPVVGAVAPRLWQLVAEAAEADPRFAIGRHRWQVLLCGSPALVDSATAALAAGGVDPARIAVDRYEPAAAALVDAAA